MFKIRDNKNISLLFVDKEYKGKDIAKRLFHDSLKTCIQRDSSLYKFNVHSSLFSIPIYMKLDFKETKVMQIQFGKNYSDGNDD